MLDNYNERLFHGKSFRSRLHLARYIWLGKKIKQYNCSTDRILELGCFDGKSLEFLEKLPLEYEGYDANWEGGLDIGKEKWKEHPGYRFKLCTKIDDFRPEENHFDISVCQETMEHLPLKDLHTYLDRLSKATKTYCFISVPNEKGMVFLAKHIGKTLTQKKREVEEFTYAELFYSTIGNMKKVERNETGHKGFDYKDLQKSIEQYFEIIETTALPFTALPVSLNFTVGFVCKKK